MEKERVNYVTGGIGERHPQWKLRLIDEQGKVVEEASYMPIYPPRGPAVLTRSENSMRVGKHFLLDARAYVRPPPSGRYLLELIYSNRKIAHEEDCSYRILWKSAPIPVVVTNRTQKSWWRSLAPPLAILAVAILAMLVAAAAMFGKQTWLRTRDWLALAVVAILAVCWMANISSINSAIKRQTWDSNADWTMALVK